MASREAQRVLARLGRLNRTAVFLVTAALVATALLIGGVFSAAALMAIAAGLAALTATTWPQADARVRAVRSIMIVLLVGLAAVALTR